ncbi:MAG: hypothetical protein ABII00_05530 [Elusimicrobiota bacterium]
MNKNHTQYFALPVPEPMRCCGKPMIEQGVQQAVASRPSVLAPAGPLRDAKKWWRVWK